MKKILCLLLAILTTVCLGACAPTAAPKASAAEYIETVYPFTGDEGENLTMASVRYDGSYCGVYFGGAYFSAAGIPVTLYVYANDAHDLRFPVNGAALTSAQSAERDRLAELFRRAHALILKVDELANTSYDGADLPSGGKMPLSDVVRYNNIEEYGEATPDGYRLQIDPHTYEMMSIAQEMYTLTGGAFNPAVYRLVDLWGFSSRIYSYMEFGLPYDRRVSPETFYSREGGGYPLPDEKYVKAFSDPAFTDFSPEAVELTKDDAGQCFVTKRVQPVTVDGVSYSQWIDLGGVAKGYVVDCIKAMFTQEGYDRLSVDAGGSSLGFGYSFDGKSTALGIENSFEDYPAYAAPIATTEVAHCSVSTSGQYVRKYYVNGVEYSHILDGFSGEPAQTGIKAVTVIVPDGDEKYSAAKSDCLTTALTVMGRVGIVEFANTLKQQGMNIKFVAQYETMESKRQLLTNCTADELTCDEEAGQFGLALKLDAEGNYYYDADAHFEGKRDANKTLLIVLGCVLGASLLALIVFSFVRGRKRTLYNVQQAKKGKPFRVGDVAVYIAVALVILVLFGTFVFHKETDAVQLVRVIDEQTGETLFVYNPIRNETMINGYNYRGWKIEIVSSSASGMTVRFSCEIDDETRFNELKIVRGRNFSVKMTDSLCGYHRDCVRNFPAITQPGGAIVCSPNRLKVVTA